MSVTFKDQLLAEFANHGFPNIKMNLWKDHLLYVNIKGMSTVTFDLEKSYKRQSYTCKISSKEMLGPAVFRNLVTLSGYIKRHEWKVRKLFEDNSYISSKGWTYE